jgi:hypothetical protein
MGNSAAQDNTQQKKFNPRRSEKYKIKKPGNGIKL